VACEAYKVVQRSCSDDNVSRRASWTSYFPVVENATYNNHYATPGISAQLGYGLGKYAANSWIQTMLAMYKSTQRHEILGWAIETDIFE
jgi:hypothetical protein